MTNAQRVVVVFGGGGAKSIAHAGAWKAFREAGIAPAHIIGTSMGAVIGAALAAGSSPEWILEVALSLEKKDFAALDAWSVAKGVFAGSILKPEPLKRTIARLVPVTRFADMKIPLTVTTTDLDSGDLVLFGALGQDGPLIDALYASCALPLYLPGQQIDGRRLGEGGLRAVVGLDVARRVSPRVDLVVAVHVGPGFDEPPVAKKAAIPALVRAHGEAIRIMMAAQSERLVADWPKDAPRLVFVRAVAEREATFASDRAQGFFDAGYRKTRDALMSVAELPSPSPTPLPSRSPRAS